MLAPAQAVSVTQLCLSQASRRRGIKLAVPHPSNKVWWRLEFVSGFGQRTCRRDRAICPVLEHLSSARHARVDARAPRKRSARCQRECVGHDIEAYGEWCGASLGCRT